MPGNLRMRFKTNCATRFNPCSPTTCGARSCLPTASSNQRKKIVYLVDLVCLVDLVHLVSFFQPKNQTNQITHRLSHRSSVSRWPATDWGSTTIEEFLALASQWQTARSGRHRLSSGGRTRRPARIGGHLQPYLN